VGAIRRALGQRGLRLLLGAGLVSLTGDWVLRVGLAYYVYALTGSTLASASMLLASFVPQILLGSLAGVFVDRWDRRRTMVLANLALALGLLPLLAVERPGQIWIVYVVLTWEGCVQQFFSPAELSALPALAGDEHLLTANALGSQNQDLSRLVGSAVGGVLAAAGGIDPLALVDLASFVASAALIARISLPSEVAARESAGASLRHRVADLRGEWGDGLRLAVHEPMLRLVLVFLLVTSVGQGIFSTLFAPFVRSVLHGGGAAYGVIVSVQAIGGIGGGLLVAGLGNRWRPARMLGCAAVVFGLVDLALILYPLVWTAVWPAAALITLAGVPGAFIVAAAMTLLQQHTGDRYRGRVFGALGAVEGVAMVVGILAAGALGGSVGIVPVLVTQGVGYVLAGALVLAGLTRTAPAPRSHPAALPAGPQTERSRCA
jgi:Na+/melibiose symporter-like transporter